MPVGAQPAETLLQQVDAVLEPPASGKAVAAMAEPHRLVGPQRIFGGVRHQPFGDRAGGVVIADPEEDIGRPDLGDGQRERIVELLGLGDGVVRRRHRLFGKTPQPQRARRGDHGDDPVIVAEPGQAEPARGFALRQRRRTALPCRVLLSDQVLRHPDHPLRHQHAGGIGDAVGDRAALFRQRERALKSLTRVR